MGRRSAFRDWRNYLLLAASLLVCLVLLEVFLRVVTPTSVFHPNLPLYPNLRMVLDVDLQGVHGRKRHTTNAWGMRGDPIPKDWNRWKTIVTIGGSTTQCYYLGDEETWPARLQALLRRDDPAILVENAGLDGHSTRGHLLMMRKVIPIIRPDMVILLAGNNDLGLSLNEQRFLFGNPYEMTGIRYRIFSHSKVAQLLFSWYQILVNKTPRATRRFASRYVPQPLPPSERTPLPADLTAMLPSLPEFRSNVERIIDLARGMDVQVVFLTQPMLYDDTPAWDSVWGSAYWLRKQRYGLSARTYWRMLGIFNETLLTICRERGVPCLDLASRIPHEQRYFYDMAHFTVAGADRVAREVAAFLREEGLLRGLDPAGRRTDPASPPARQGALGPGALGGSDPPAPRGQGGSGTGPTFTGGPAGSAARAGR